MKTKMNKRILSCALLCALVISGCNSADEPGIADEKAPLVKISLDAGQENYVSASNQFAKNLFKTLDKASCVSGKNYVFSPLSLHLNLSLLANGASGEILEEITDVLLPGLSEVPSLDMLNELNRTLVARLPETDVKAKFSLANSIWLGNNLNVRDDFKQRMEKYYGASFFKFGVGTEQARVDMNRWCSNATAGMIEEFFQSPPTQELILLNALFFQHIWSSPFKPSDTRDIEFYCESGNTVKTPTMCQEYTGTVYMDEKGTRTVLKYGNGAFEMHLVKPDAGSTVSDALTGGQGEEYLRKIRLRMPKFEFDSDISFKNILCEMGMKKALAPQASYSNFSTQTMQIDEIRQKTKINVDEKGTKLASVTHTGMNAAAGPPPEVIDFYLDHPFGFIIRETSTNAVIAMGKICEL